MFKNHLFILCLIAFSGTCFSAETNTNIVNETNVVNFLMKSISYNDVKSDFEESLPKISNNYKRPASHSFDEFDPDAPGYLTNKEPDNLNPNLCKINYVNHSDKEPFTDCNHTKDDNNKVDSQNHQAPSNRKYKKFKLRHVDYSIKPIVATETTYFIPISDSTL